MDGGIRDFGLALTGQRFEFGIRTDFADVVHVHMTIDLDFWFSTCALTMYRSTEPVTSVTTGEMTLRLLELRMVKAHLLGPDVKRPCQ